MNQESINKLKNITDGRIGDGIYIAFEYHNKNLKKVFIGSDTCGPMLQYEAEWHDMYTGLKRVNFDKGCWTNCYSRGNFGKKFAFGGKWSGHTKNLHNRLRVSPILDQHHEIMFDADNNQIPLPPGIKGDISVLDMDCSGSWSIWYPTALEALNNRLTKHEIEESTLPNISKAHLLKNQTEYVLDALNDVIEAYNL